MLKLVLKKFKTVYHHKIHTMYPVYFLHVIIKKSPYNNLKVYQNLKWKNWYQMKNACFISDTYFCVKLVNY